MREFVIIADDFTGANDTGVQVRKHGMPIDVILDIDMIGPGEENISIDTESRVVSPEEAYAKVYQAVCRVLKRGGCKHLYKKVDSTLRGNIKTEIRAAMETFKPEVIVFAPAYPEQGRTTVNGRLCVQGVPLLETEIAKDPRNPIEEDNTNTILADCTKENVKHVDSAGLSDTDILKWENGYYTFDASTTDDLARVAAMALKLHKKTLWIGSAGLAEGLLAVTHPTFPVLAAVGSVSSRTMEQIDYCRAHGVVIAELDMVRIFGGMALADAIQPALEGLAAGKDVLLTAASSREAFEAFVAFGASQGIGTDTLAEFTKQILSKAVAAVLRAIQGKVGGMFLTGGDTAIAVTRILGASGSRIEQQLFPGFVLGRLNGGMYANMPIVTKAGAFGTEVHIYESMNKLREITT